jgi:hypothetical protein
MKYSGKNKAGLLKAWGKDKIALSFQEIRETTINIIFAHWMKERNIWAIESVFHKKFKLCI